MIQQCSKYVWWDMGVCCDMVKLIECSAVIFAIQKGDAVVNGLTVPVAECGVLRVWDELKKQHLQVSKFQWTSVAVQ